MRRINFYSAVKISPCAAAEKLLLKPFTHAPAGLQTTQQRLPSIQILHAAASLLTTVSKEL